MENAVLPDRKIITGQRRIVQEDYDIRDILDHLSRDNARHKRQGRKNSSGNSPGSMTARTSLVFMVRSLHYLYQMMMRNYFLFC